MIRIRARFDFVISGSAQQCRTRLVHFECVAQVDCRNALSRTHGVGHMDSFGPGATWERRL